MEQVHRHLNILHKQRHQHRPPFSRSPPARPRSPFSETFTTRRFLINFLWCLESIRSNIPLFKTSCLLLESREGRRRKGKGKGEGPPQISTSAEGKVRGGGWSSGTGRRCVGREWLVAESSGTRRERISIVGSSERRRSRCHLGNTLKPLTAKKKFALKKKTYTQQ